MPAVAPSGQRPLRAQPTLTLESFPAVALRNSATGGWQRTRLPIAYAQTARVSRAARATGAGAPVSSAGYVRRPGLQRPERPCISRPMGGGFVTCA